MADIGFIGLGIMGGPMALNLQNGGHRLFLHSRSGVKEKALLDNGGTECASPAEVAKATEFIITMLPNTPDVEVVLFGEKGVSAGLTGVGRATGGGKAKLVIDMSSISPLATKSFLPNGSASSVRTTSTRPYRGARWAQRMRLLPSWLAAANRLSPAPNLFLS